MSKSTKPITSIESRYYLVDSEKGKILKVYLSSDTTVPHNVVEAMWKNQFLPVYGYETLQEARDLIPLLKTFWESELEDREDDLERDQKAKHQYKNMGYHWEDYNWQIRSTQREITKIKRYLSMDLEVMKVTVTTEMEKV